MQVALVQNGQNHVHDKDREKHQDGQARSGVAERKRFALDLTANSRRQDLLRSLLDEISGLPDGIPGFQVEEQCGARELVDVIDGLRAQHRVPSRQGVERNHARAVVALDVQQMKILRLGTLIVGNFQDYLVLVRGLLDEINVVLRVRLVQKIQNPCLGDAVGLGLLAEDVDLQIRSMVEQVGVDKEEPRKLEHLDRKSTRLNSSHTVISYAVFCLKKKKAVFHTKSV